MNLVENIPQKELVRIKRIIGEAFITNELFHEFGTVEERKDLVIKYMDIYVDYVYESKALYQNSNGSAFIGLEYSEKQAILLKLKMLWRLLFTIPLPIMKKYLGHVKQIKDGNSRYTGQSHLAILMVCVSKDNQGKGYARELVDFAKQMSHEKQVPILFDTDMKDYAEMYQHMGCELYNSKTASNGVTRYNLVWKDGEKHET